MDLGILERTDRVWASDTNDALERQAIQRWTGLLLPPELVGTHIGPPVAHTTGRAANLTFRALTALFGHAGLEWDITTCDDAELETLRSWVALYREVRGLMHSGDVVRVDHPDPGAWVHGVVARDRREALFWYVRLATSADAGPGRILLPGLDPDLEYAVSVRRDAGVAVGARARDADVWVRGGTHARGAVLARIGIVAPLIGPGQAVLLHLRDRSVQG